MCILQTLRVQLARHFIQPLSHYSCAAAITALCLGSGLCTSLLAQEIVALPPTTNEVAIDYFDPQTAETYPIVLAETDLESRVKQLEEIIQQQDAQLKKLADKAGTSGKEQEKTPESNAAKPAASGGDMKMSATWKNGLEIQTANKDFRIHVGGRTQVDGVWLKDSPVFDSAGGVGDADAVDFRRARLRVDGTIWEVHEFAAEYDLVNNVNDNVGLQPASQTIGNLGNPNVINVPAMTDLWWDVGELPIVGHFRFGNMKEPLGLEHLTSSRYLDFMERSFNQDAFTGPFNNGFSPGLMFWNMAEDKRATYQIGMFKNTTNVFGYGIGDGEYATTGRVSWLPWYDEASKGRHLLHLGIAGSLRDPDEGLVRYRSRGSLRNGPGAFNPVFADTGTFFADQQEQICAEAALVMGPWLFQAEYFGSNNTNARSLGGTPFGDVFVHGYYAEALYFLTGEHRAYDHERGAFGRVVPKENWLRIRTCDGIAGGPGAWQIGARYSKLDLNNSGLNGGVIQDITLGLNWFWNPSMKWQFNYVLTERDAPAAGDGIMHGAGVRFAHDF